jgi:hypothetical protein
MWVEIQRTIRRFIEEQETLYNSACRLLYICCTCLQNKPNFDFCLCFLIFLLLEAFYSTSIPTRFWWYQDADISGTGTCLYERQSRS